MSTDMRATGNDVQAMKAAFERDGYVHIPGALPPEQVAILTEKVDKIWDEERTDRPISGAKALHLLAFCGREPEFLEMLDPPGTLPLVVEMIGTNIFMFHCHLDVHPPEPDVVQPWMWHQDGGVINRDLEGEPRPRMAVKLAYFLTDVSEPGRGNFMVLPGSHMVNRIDRPADDDNDIPGATPILAEPGDAVMFDRRLWHARSPNRSDITRKAIFFAYTFRWVRTRDDLEVKPELRDGLTPVRHQLLGEAEHAIDYWMPDLVEPPLTAQFKRVDVTEPPAQMM
jgi:ectoine hydroxylase-related dioxygenase (phytanoyl-CoA dioxygenase family)